MGLYIVKAGGQVYGFSAGNPPPGGTLPTVTLQNFGGSTQANPEFRFAHVFKQGDVPSGSRLTLKQPDLTDIPFTAARVNTWPDGSLRCVDILGKMPGYILAAGASANLTLGTTSGAFSSALPGGKTVAQVVSDITTNFDPIKVKLLGLTDAAGAAVGSGTWQADTTTAFGLGSTSGGYSAKATGPAAADLWVWMNLKDGATESPSLAAVWYIAAYLDLTTGAVTKLCWRAWLVQGYRTVIQQRFRCQPQILLGATVVRSWGGTSGDGRTFDFTGAATNTTTNRITVGAHSFVNGSVVRFTTTGTLPAPLATATDYWVQVQSDGTLGICSVAESAINNGSILDLTTQGTGTHTVAGYVILNRWQRLSLADLDAGWDWHAGATGAFGGEPTIHPIQSNVYYRKSRMAPPLDLSIVFANPTEVSPQKYAPGTFGGMNLRSSTGGANISYGAPFNEWQARAFHSPEDRTGYVQTARVHALCMGTWLNHMLETNGRIPALIPGTYTGLNSATTTTLTGSHAFRSADVPAPLGNTDPFPAYSYDQSHHYTNLYGRYIFDGGQDLLDLLLSDCNNVMLQRLLGDPNGFFSSVRPLVAGGVSYYSAIPCGEPRQAAWRLNLAVDTVCVVPDGSPEQTYFKKILDDTLAFAAYLINTAEGTNYRALGGWHFEEVERSGPLGPTNVSQSGSVSQNPDQLTGFMQDYWGLVAGHAYPRYTTANMTVLCNHIAQWEKTLWVDPACKAWSNAYNKLVKDKPGSASPPPASSSNYLSKANLGFRDDGSDGVFFSADGTVTRLLNGSVQAFTLNSGVRVWLTDNYDQFLQSTALPPTEVSPYTWYYCRQIAGNPGSVALGTGTFKLSTTPDDTGIIGSTTPAASTTLSAGINASVTTLPLVGTLSIPSYISATYGGVRLVKIDSELIVVTGGNGTNSLTVTRGAYGTTAAIHSAGAVVQPLPVVIACFDPQNVVVGCPTRIYRFGGAAGAVQFGYLTMPRAACAYFYVDGLMGIEGWNNTDAFFQLETAGGTGPAGFGSSNSLMHSAVTSV
jgi:hypothetical protein